MASGRAAAGEQPEREIVIVLRTHSTQLQQLAVVLSGGPMQ